MVQLVVYAGAVMVLFLFVIMLLNLDQITAPIEPNSMRWWTGALIAFAVLGLVLASFKGAVFPVAPKIAAAALERGNTVDLAGSLFTTYILPFEIASVLLLAAIVGAVLLVRKKS
jgi:NADH-quinone oxidoreductase subunit J